MNFSKQVGRHLASVLREMIELDEAGSDSLTTNFHKAHRKWQDAAPDPKDVGWRSAAYGKSHDVTMGRQQYVDSKIAKKHPSFYDGKMKTHIDGIDSVENKKIAKRQDHLKYKIAGLRREIAMSKSEGRTTKTKEKELKTLEDHLKRLAVPTQRKFDTTDVGKDGLKPYERNKEHGRDWDEYFKG